MSANLTKIAAAMVLAATPLVAAPAFAQDEPEAPRTSYQVIMLKLAPNAGDRWSEMMDTYYAPAAEAAGLPKTEVHWLMDGGWDIMLLRPMPRGMISLDTHASRDAPPTIIFSAADDTITPPGHGIALFEALTAAGAKAELHIFEEGGHGWGLGTQDQILNQWPEIFEAWLTRRTQSRNRGE